MCRLRIALTAALFLTCSVAIGANKPRKVTDEEVRRVHESAILIDLHNDVTSATVKGVEFGKRNSDTHTDTVRLKEGGVSAVFFAAYVSRTYVPKGQSAHRVLEMIDTVRHDVVERYPDDYILALSADDIVRAKREGKIAALIGIEGGHAIEDNLRILRNTYALGVRYMTLTHSNTNNWADSSGDIDNDSVKHHGGLTAFGRDVVAEMNRLGMVVDVSHVADDVFWQVLDLSEAPVMATHSSCRSISNIARNMSDKMIKALGEKGGVVHINFGCEFLSQASADTSAYFNPALKGKDGQKTVRATIADVVAHINHVVELAGIDAVGIGSDYDGVDCVPEGLDDVSDFPNLTRALLEAGYSAADVRRIYGENTLRVMRGAERVAATR
jgi:membrane dipeptidase